MKIVIKALLILSLGSLTTISLAQEKTDSTGVRHTVKQAGKTTGKVVKKTGKKVGEVGAKSAAKVKDKSLKEKGPNGETVYIDKYERKYYVDKDAKRVYIK
ncbi:hypothetical protein [Desertivirga brevis]|uniref:hypothetical protein n=1 Tax=Desertivirga brevis TaxID=2810310 RepID=UPI001A95A1C8|nr:hypothetical protein [Pedobacter sp. SYSU D00873]